MKNVYCVLIIVFCSSIKASHPRDLDVAINLGKYREIKNYSLQVKKLNSQGLVPFQKAALCIRAERDAGVKRKREFVACELLKYGADPFHYTMPASLEDRFVPLELIGTYASPQGLIDTVSYIKDKGLNKKRAHDELLFGMQKRPEWKRMHKTTRLEQALGAPKNIEKLRRAESYILTNLGTK